MIEIKNANVKRNGIYIIKDLNLEVKENDNIAIIGPNGAGKSTLLNIISREVYPLALENYKNSIFGKEKWIMSDLKKQVGVVNHQISFLNSTSYSVFEIVLSGLYSSIGLDFHHIVKKEDEILAIEELKNVGLLHLKNKCMKNLSSGEKTRVLIARAAITKPRLLLLDEASNNLDFVSRDELRNTISSYVKQSKNIIMVTHELSEIVKEVNRIIIMKNGLIAKDGNKEEILNEKILSDIYEKTVYLDKRNGLYNAWC